MVIAFSWRNIVRHSNMIIKIVIMAIILLYILPKLLSSFLEFTNPDPIKERNLLEKPLRVQVYNIV